MRQFEIESRAADKSLPSIRSCGDQRLEAVSEELLAAILSTSKGRSEKYIDWQISTGSRASSRWLFDAYHVT
jgi:hypothetical protein